MWQSKVLNSLDHCTIHYESLCSTFNVQSSPLWTPTRGLYFSEGHSIYPVNAGFCHVLKYIPRVRLRYSAGLEKFAHGGSWKSLEVQNQSIATT